MRVEDIDTTVELDKLVAELIELLANKRLSEAEVMAKLGEAMTTEEERDESD